MNIQENISLKRLNTFGIDASAKYFVEVRTTGGLTELFNDSRFEGERKLILGGGSNILLQNDFDGLVLKIGMKGVNLVDKNDDSYFIKAGAGENWHELVMYCVNHGYGGVENLSLIPGNVGAAPMQNIGAYGVELKDVFHELEAYDIKSGELSVFDSSHCKFGYRESVFKNELRDTHIICSVTLRLPKKSVINTSYGAIEQELESMGIKDVDIEAVSQAVINIRSSKLPDPKELGNAGSFFKNPIVSQDQFSDLKGDYGDMVSYPAADGVKLAAGWLIDQCGWKGKRVGEAGVHENHALVLANYGAATGSEIYNLSQEILESVQEKFGVSLEREVNVIGRS